MMASAAQDLGRGSINFAPMMGKVARHLLGEPNGHLSRGPRLRFGSKGSMEVDTAEGWFDDHEAKVSGGVLELIRHKEGCDTAAAFRWLEAQGIKDPGARRTDAPHERVGGRDRSVFYDYTDEHGEVLFRVERRGKNASPPFLQHGPDGQGGFHSARGCMQGVRRVPYRLPELLAAPVDAIVFVSEGEKDADRLGDLGLITTTNPGGAGKFTRELARFLAGRRVVALQDNDEPGAAHVATVLDAVNGIATASAALLLPGLPPKGDVSDWLGSGEAVDELVRLAGAALTATEKPAKLLPLLNPGDWHGTRTPDRQWSVEEWIPARQMTYLTGPGSAGKSLLTQQLCTSVALGLPFMGIETRQAVAIYVTCEDDADELHRRQKAICESLGVDLRALAGKLHLVSLAGEIGNELATFDGEGKMALAPAWNVLHATALVTKAGFVALDNVAHLYGGNENIRHEVAAFCSLLNRLAHDANAAVLLLGHPNKAGDAFSGSTAWENQVRSRLFLETPKDGDGTIVDPDVRALSRGKANYARNGERVEFRWHKWAFVRGEDLGENAAAQLAASAQAAHDNAVFLACLAERTRQKRPVSEKSGKNFAPVVFAAMSEARRVPKPRLEASMDRLFRLGAIEHGHLWRDTAEGRNAHGLKLSATVDQGSATGSATDPLTRVANDRDQFPQSPANTHTPPKGGEGAAIQATAPSHEDDDDQPIPGWDD